jgi:hypothetical protein
MEEDLFVQAGGEARVTRIPGLKIGSQKDLSQSDNSIKVNKATLGGVKGSRKEEIANNSSYAPHIDDRGSKLAERLVRLNQKTKEVPMVRMEPSQETKTIGTILLLSSFLSGVLLGRWSSKINLTIGE